MSRVRTKTGGIPYARYQLQRAILESALENNYTTEEHEAAIRFFEEYALKRGFNHGYLLLRGLSKVGWR